MHKGHAMLETKPVSEQPNPTSQDAKDYLNNVICSEMLQWYIWDNDMNDLNYAK